MIIEIEETRHKLTNFRNNIKELGSALRIDALREEVAQLEEKTSAPDFWNDQENSGKILRQVKQLKDKIERYDALSAKLEDAITLCDLAIEEGDESMKDEILAEAAEVEAQEEQMRIEVLLSASTPAPAAQRPRTGPRCSIACTPAGGNPMDTM